MDMREKTINLLPPRKKFRRNCGVAAGVLFLLFALEGGKYWMHRSAWQTLQEQYQARWGAVGAETDDFSQIVLPDSAVHLDWVAYIDSIWPNQVAFVSLQAGEGGVSISGAAESFQAIHALLEALADNPFHYQLRTLESSDPSASGAIAFTATYF